MKKACTILIRKPEEERPLERPRSRWDDNSKANEVRGCGVHSTGSVQFILK
jgi:hypothetical protein